MSRFSCRMQASKHLQQHMPTALSEDVFDMVDGPSWEKEESFSQDLFNDEAIVKIRDAAIATEFIQGMVSGTLHPNHYGGYMVQDAAYCFAAVEACVNAAKVMQQQEMLQFSSFYLKMSETYKEYNEAFVTTWHLKNSDSIAMGPAAAQYVKYEAGVSRKYPKFLAIAMLPCMMLWPWIANQLIGRVEKNKNPYHFWFEENKTDQKSDLEKFVDSQSFSPEEKKLALDIFHDGMSNELKFFQEACNREALTELCDSKLPFCVLL